jgi:Domain of unknown function (DUF4276)
MADVFVRHSIACIVEGDGEETAVPLLVARVARLLDPPAYINAFVSQRISRGRLVKQPHLEKAIEFAARAIGRQGAILVLIDADDDCPATLGPTMLQWASAARIDIPIAVVLAKREFEAWFLASAASLQGQYGSPPDLQPPPDPEGIRDAKGWIGKRMPHGQPYREVLHQVAFTKTFDLTLARAADSFDKFQRDIALLIARLRQGQTSVRSTTGFPLLT